MAKANIDVKTLLKDARKFITDKEYDKALEVCKTILGAEKNYNALVFAGLAYQKLGQLELCISSYETACALQPQQVLAWQVTLSFWRMPSFRRSG